MNLSKWAEARLGVSEWLGELLGGKVHAAPSWARAFAVALMVALGLAAVTGLGLGFVYAPASASAWASVYFTEYVLRGGWFVRSLHVASAESSIVLGAITLLLTVLEGRHRGRRDLPFWCLGLVVAVTLVFCITGNPLRWDNRGYFGFATESNIAAEVPLVGRHVRALLVGGAVPGNWTLTRLYALHTTLLPLATAAILLLWRRAARRAEDVRAAAAPGEPPSYGDVQLGRDLGAAFFFTAVTVVIGYLVRAPLEAPADPLASYNARPEWYFEGLYVLRNAVPPTMQGPVASLLPPVLGGFLLALPLLDRDPDAPLKRRLPSVGAMGAILLGALALTLVGLRADAKNPELGAARKRQSQVDRRAVQIAHTDGVPPAGALAMMRQDPVLRAQDLFQEKCASCHRLGNLAPHDGKTTASSLDGWGTAAWVMAVLDDPDAPDKFGLTAYKGKMPSYTRPPTDPVAAKDWKPMPLEQQQAIARYLAAEASGAAKGHDADGEKLVRQRCTSCHLLHGESDDPNGYAPELSGWASLGWLRAQIANPGTNTTYRPISLSPELDGHMPRYDTDLGAEQIDLLTRFVKQRASRIRP